GPGFINFFVDNHYLTELIPTILEQQENYGSSNIGGNEKVQVEFVSANPTGDLHLGHARGADVGDTLSNILEEAAFQVKREYYINDAGNQINNVAKSVQGRYMQALGKDFPMPEDGYHGADIIKMAEQLEKEFGDLLAGKSEEEQQAFFREYGL